MADDASADDKRRYSADARSAERSCAKPKSATFAVAASRPFPWKLSARKPLFAAWYELFPRSTAQTPTVATVLFDDVVGRLPALRDMGFDVLYLPPIHPDRQNQSQGQEQRTGCKPDDVGSPYAIGSSEGGHDAIHPALGTIEDFRRLRDAAAAHGLELALDFAIQCSPDHPWLKEHPEWFDWRPDGSIRFAENPPKKYEDIVNVDFYAEEAIPHLWTALRDIVLFWADEGVRIFRVDNPHTKPLPFWEWLIAEVRSQNADVIFLSEAFTRPKMMYRLAKAGFSQSYTYFTWRNTKQELDRLFHRADNTGGQRILPTAFVCQYAGHQSILPSDLGPSGVSDPRRAGGDPIWVMGHLFRLRTVRGGGIAGPRGISRTRKNIKSVRANSTDLEILPPQSANLTASAGRILRCKPIWDCDSTPPTATMLFFTAKGCRLAAILSSAPSISTLSTPRKRPSKFPCGSGACPTRRLSPLPT